MRHRAATLPCKARDAIREEQSAELGRGGVFGREGKAALVLKGKAGQGLAWVKLTTQQVYRKLCANAQFPDKYFTVVAINRLISYFTLRRLANPACKLFNVSSAASN